MHLLKVNNQTFYGTSTLGEMLRPAGYRTYWAGKHHASFDPRSRGFDRFYGFLGGAINFWNPGATPAPGGLQPAYIEAYKWVLDKPEVVGSFVPDRTDWFATDVFTDKGIEWLKENRSEEKPFLLYMAYNAPHWPLQAPKKYIDRCRGRYDAGYDAIRKARYERQIKLGIVDPKMSPLSEPDTNQAWESLSEVQRQRQIEQMEVYAAMIENLDDNIGLLLNTLREQGRLDNTLVMFLSDNGACSANPTRRVKHFSDKVPVGGVDSYDGYGKSWANVSNTPLRNFKLSSHEGGIRTPMIAHWPKGISNPGRSSDEPVHLIDILPTLADISGSKMETSLPGISLTPYFKNDKLIRKGDLFWQFGSGRALRRGDMKLVTHKEKPWELYDLAQDATETLNLATKRPEVVQDMGKAWDHWWKNTTGPEYKEK